MIQIALQLKNQNATLCLSGRFEFQALKPFQDAINKARGSNPRKIILNFSKVSFIDSAGLGLLMVMRGKLEKANIGLALEVPLGIVMDILNLANIGKAIPISLIDADMASRTSPRETSTVRRHPVPPLVFESDEMQKLILPILKILDQNDFNLPPLPEVAGQVLALTVDPNATANRLTTIIQHDPVLTAKIFRYANSAGCGTSQTIESLPQAIAWLGLNTVGGLALALSIQSDVFNDRGYKKEVRELWAHAIATAFFGKMLAGMIGKSSDIAFLCGLLHNIGKLAVVHLVNQNHKPSAPPLQWSVMLTLIEQSYIEIGRKLADAWKFPLPVKEAIIHHQHYSYHLATHPSKGAAITCLSRHLATNLLDSVAISEETIRALPVAAMLNLPLTVMNGILESKVVIQEQINSLIH